MDYVRLLLVSTLLMMAGCTHTGAQPAPSTPSSASAADEVEAEAERSTRARAVNRTESRALSAAFGPRSRPWKLKYLRLLCQKRSSSSMSYLRAADYRSSKFRVARAASILCPNWPLRDFVENLYDNSKTLTRLKRKGRVFADDTYRVGDQVRPGTYYVTNTQSCYWARKNKNDVIIQERRVEYPTTRVQLTIYKSDHTFVSRRCGLWQPVED